MSNQQWMQRLQTVECRDSSYAAAQSPLVFARAQGSTIWDAENRSYIDLCAGFGVLALGHNSEVQKRVFASSMTDDPLVVHGMGDVYPSIAKIELLESVTQVLPNHLAKGALALSGGQAVELAVKTAQIATGSRGFISFQGSYHGLDLGILPLTSRADFKRPFSGWIQEQLVTELPFACDPKMIQAAIVAQKNGASGCAAVIIEPIQGRAGVKSPPQGWLAELAAVCRSENILLIYDEVFTGLGRTGRMSFADEVPCDLLCLGKALGGGLPLSACFGRSEVMDAWPQNQGEAIHTGTFFGHPLSCRLGSATLQAIVAENLPARAIHLGAQLRRELREALADYPAFLDVRGQGLMIGLEFREAGFGARLMDSLRARGVLALASGSQGEGISMTPALNIPEGQLRKASEILLQTLQSLI